MKPFNSVLAFVRGCVTAIALGLAAAVAAQGADESILVCVAKDGVLRLASGKCPPGQDSLVLKKAGPDDGNAPEADDDSKREKDRKPDPSAALKHRIDELERQVKALEKLADHGELGNKVVVPFEVVDRSGKRIFYVNDVVGVYNGTGKRVAVMGAGPGGGFFTAASVSGDLTASLSAEYKAAGVLVSEGEAGRVALGKDAKEGHYRLKFVSGEGKNVAAIGESPETHSGLALVNDLAGRPLVRIGTNREGRGFVAVFKGQQQSIAELTEGDTQGGRLALFNSNGENMVAAGVHQGGFGVVRAGPSGFKEVFGGPLGLPGSYIAGKPQ